MEYTTWGGRNRPYRLGRSASDSSLFRVKQCIEEFLYGAWRPVIQNFVEVNPMVGDGLLLIYIV